MTPGHYRGIAEFPIGMVAETGGLSNFHYEKTTGRKNVPGLAWAYISNYLQYPKNDLTEESYIRVVELIGLTKEELRLIEEHPFQKCSEYIFYAIQYFMLACYQDLEYRLVEKMFRTIVIRSAKFELTFERRGSRQFILVPFHIMGKLAGKIATKYTTLATCRSRTLDPFWSGKKRIEMEFEYSATPRRHHPELGRPSELIVDGERFNPSEETVYRSGLSGFVSILSCSINTYGLGL
ncbi:MAG: hypothetical protein JXA20_18630 [Spirochaetes bacterium]|nr:hypothetical protein [Spirochaetota bacterium]